MVKQPGQTPAAKKRGMQIKNQYGAQGQSPIAKIPRQNYAMLQQLATMSSLSKRI